MAELLFCNEGRIDVLRGNEFPRAIGRGFVKPRRMAG